MKRRIFKDRKDAKRVDNITGMNQILLDLKPYRSEGEVYINRKIDVTNVVNYVNEYKENHSEEDKLTLFHLFVTAIGKTIYNRPYLNRFVANRHVYEHNEIIVSFVAKIEFNDTAEEVMVLVPIKKEDTLFDIANKIKKKVNKRRAQKIKVLMVQY